MAALNFLNLLRFDYWLDPTARWRLFMLGPALMAFLVLARPAIRRARADGLPGAALAALAFQPVPATEWRASTKALWLGGHAFWLAVSFVNLPPFGLPWLPAFFALPLLLALAPAWRRPLSTPALASLTPLCYAYASALFTALQRAAGWPPITGPLNGLLYPPLALIVCGAHACAACARQMIAPDASFVKVGAAALIAASLGWSLWTASQLRTHGVSGSDPYAYAQMGIDLAERGTLAHAFPLVEETWALGIDSHPVTHVGYRLPADARRVAPTVWPPGYALFTALAWRVGGETGIYWLTPLLNFAALLTVAWLAMALLPTLAIGERQTVAALAAFLTATSLTQVEWQMVPMADIAAQLFSLCALGLALGRGRRAWLNALLAGVCLGMAFNVRYTQVLIAPALAYVLQTQGTHEGHPEASSGQALRLRLRMTTLLCALTAALTVLPTLVYHATWFGGPFHTASEELANFSLAHMPGTALALLGAWHAPREFGLLTPLIAIGIIALWRRARQALIALALYALPLFALHVFYDYLRPRDLLSLFPVLALCAALGTVTIARRVAIWRGTARLGSGAALFAIAFLFVLRSMQTLALPVNHGFGIFGHLVAGQRSAFTALAALTERDALIGCGLNSGAVELHAGRQAFRPAVWDAPSRTKFIDAMRALHRPVYLLIDSDEMQSALPALRATYTLTALAELPMPFYLAGGGAEDRLVTLMRVSQ